MLLDSRAKVPDQRAWFDERDGEIQCLPRRLHEANRVCVLQGARSDIVRLVEVGVVALVVDGNVQVDDVAVKKDTLIGNAVTYNLIRRRAERLGEVVVVQR